MHINTKHEKGFGLILLLVGVALAIAGGTVYLHRNNKPSIKEILESTAIKPTPNTPQDPSTLTPAFLTQLKSQLIVATAKVDSAKATLAPLVGKATPAAIESKFDKLVTALEKTTDVLFKNPDSRQPEIIISASTPAITSAIAAINSKRLEITELLASWKIKKDNPSTTPAELATIAHNDAIFIQTYIMELAAIVNALTPTNSGLTQAQIDIYVQNLNTVQQIATTAVAEMAAIETSIEQAIAALQQAQQNQAALETQVQQTTTAIQNQSPASSPNPTNPFPDDVDEEVIDWEAQRANHSLEAPKLIEGANKN